LAFSAVAAYAEPNTLVPGDYCNASTQECIRLNSADMSGNYSSLVGPLNVTYKTADGNDHIVQCMNNAPIGFTLEPSVTINITNATSSTGVVNHFIASGEYIAESDSPRLEIDVIWNANDLDSEMDGTPCPKNSKSVLTSKETFVLVK